MELMTFVAMVFLVLIWVRLGAIRKQVAGAWVRFADALGAIDSRLADIEQRVRDNFETDEEREDVASSRP